MVNLPADRDGTDHVELSLGQAHLAGVVVVADGVVHDDEVRGEPVVGVVDDGVDQDDDVSELDDVVALGEHVDVDVALGEHVDNVAGFELIVKDDVEDDVNVGVVVVNVGFVVAADRPAAVVAVEHVGVGCPDGVQVGLG